MTEFMIYIYMTILPIESIVTLLSPCATNSVQLKIISYTSII